jgi:hypothetical protein
MSIRGSFHGGKVKLATHLSKLPRLQRLGALSSLVFYAFKKWWCFDIDDNTCTRNERNNERGKQ